VRRNSDTPSTLRAAVFVTTAVYSLRPLGVAGRGLADTARVRDWGSSMIDTASLVTASISPPPS